MKDNHSFTKDDLKNRFERNIGKTLGQIDNTGLFEKIRTDHIKKVTGIAGDVVEQSILGYPADNKQRPDIIVDGMPTEVKTTGLKLSKGSINKKKINLKSLEAKEPMSITAVSPKTIANEDNFYDSNFWHKIAHLLFVYYFYNSQSTVKPLDYADFKLIGYFPYEFDEGSKQILQQDWRRVRDFIRNIQNEDPIDESQYSLLSSDLNRFLMLIDTAPKWPNPPRFRLKTSVVSSIYYEYCSGKSLEELESPFQNFDELDQKLQAFTAKYSGNTVEQLKLKLHIPNSNIGSTEDKAITAQLILRMFDASSTRLSDVKIFREAGLIAKSFTLNANGKGAEDFRLYGLQVKNWTGESSEFQESELYHYLIANQFIVGIFQKSPTSKSAADKRFVGFKRIYFEDSFVLNAGKRLWEDTRNKIINHTLRNVPKLDSHGQPTIIKRTGKVSTAPNFLKSTDNPLFIRGSGINSDHKPYDINGVKMYHPDVWIAREEITNRLD